MDITWNPTNAFFTPAINDLIISPTFTNYTDIRFPAQPDVYNHKQMLINPPNPVVMTITITSANIFIYEPLIQPKTKNCYHATKKVKTAVLRALTNVDFDTKLVLEIDQIQINHVAALPEILQEPMVK